MSTTFFSKKEALKMGLFYCGRTDIDISTIKKIDTDHINQFGFSHEEQIDLYNIETSEGNKVQLGIEPFRNGFCLWLIDPETGFSRRV